MGILDDAIKEHLELKRQHGAGESELQQLEDEAFGAAERPGDEGTVPDPLAEAAAGPSTEERQEIAEQPTEMYDVEEELGGSEATGPSEEELVEEEMGEPRLAPVDPLSELDGEGEADDEEEAEADEDEADDFFDEQRLSDELDQALEAPRDAGEEFEHEEDVLEETPDFLEETPEDDQLWFEQKPPKDFDFDD